MKKLQLTRCLVVAVLVAVSLVLVCSVQGQAASKIRWKMQIAAPAGTPYMDCATDFAKSIKASSGGRLTINVSPGGAIVPAHDTTEAIRDGVLDIANPNASMDLGRIGPKVLLMGASGFPAGPTPMEYLAWFYMGGGIDFANELYKDYNCVVIGVATPAPAELFCHSSKPLQAMDDLKGIKFRTMGLWAELLDQFGASVITVPGGEIYQSMERGVIDAFEYCGPGLDWKMGFHEVAKYMGVPGIHSPLSSNLVLVNKDSWEKLPDDLKSLVKSEVMASSLKGYMTFAWGDAQGMQEYAKHGTTIVPLSDEMQDKIAEASKKLCDKYAANDPEFKKIFEHQRDFIKQWRAWSQVVQPNKSLFDME